MDSDLHPIGRDRYDPGLICSGKEGEKCDETDDACDGSSGSDGISSRKKTQTGHCLTKSPLQTCMLNQSSVAREASVSPPSEWEALGWPNR